MDYELGGQYQIKITDEAFEKALKLITAEIETFPASDIPEVKSERQEYYRMALNSGVTKYEASNLPAVDIYSIFCAACYFQIEIDKLSEDLGSGLPWMFVSIKPNIPTVNHHYNKRQELDEDIQKWVNAEYSKYKRVEAGTVGWRLTGRGDPTFAIMLLKGLASLILSFYTGKGAAIRWFEKTFVNYIAHNSKKARNFLMDFAKKLGGEHRGLTAVAELIKDKMVILELTNKALSD